MKYINTAFLFVVIAACSGVVSAEDGELNTQFRGWLGKNQRGHFLDASGWHECPSDKGGDCGSRAMTTGSSKCQTTGFNIGAKWKVPGPGGMEINGGANRSWTACNIRTETITCTPKVHYKGRAVIHFSERWGRLRVLGGDNYLTLRSSCPAGWRSDWMGGPSWRCTYVGGSYDRDGYLPEYRHSACQYVHL